MNVKRVDGKGFKHELQNGSLPVLVDFYADWCGPCKSLAPVLEEIAGEFAGRLQVLKLNVDHEPELAAQYRVRGIPTLILFQAGKEVNRITGALPKNELTQVLQDAAVQ